VRTGLCLGAILLSACGSGREPAGEIASATPELFAPGVVSSTEPEFATAFSVTGDTVYFNRTPPDRSRLPLYFSTRENGTWSEARPFEPTAGIEAIDPFVDPGSGRLYFSSDLDGSSPSAGAFGLWYLERTEAGWSAPIPLPAPINTDSSEVFNSLTSQGEMIFSSRRDGVRRIYAAQSAGGAWSSPEVVHFGTVTEGSNAVISTDGRFIVFAQRTPRGDPDLVVSCRGETGWMEPVNLGAEVNSEFADFAPALTTSHLYFTSERPGVVGPLPDSVRRPGDIYRVGIDTVTRHCSGAGPNP
jgi:Tol biopolymer transport system component